MIVDTHAHLELPIYGVTPDPQRRKFTRLLMWSYEVLGFRNPLWRGEPPEPMRQALEAAGRERVFFGSDWPGSNSKHALNIARRAAGDGELHDRLAGGNIMALVS